MLTKEGLEKIQTWILSSTTIDKELPAIALPDSMRIHDLDFLRDTKKRIKAIYSTGSIDDFCEYIQKTPNQESRGKQVFVSMDSLKAHAIIDFGTPEAPGHCAHQALLRLESTAEWYAVSYLTVLSQHDFIDWCIDWRDNIGFTAPDGRLIEPNLAIAALRRITIDKISSGQFEVQNLRESRTAMEKIEAKCEDVIPGHLHFLCNPYEGLSERTALLRITVDLDKGAEDKILIKHRFMHREQLEQEIYLEFRELLKSRLCIDSKVYFGSIAV